MTEVSYSRVPGTSATEIAKHCRLRDIGRVLLREGMTPPDYVRLLRETGQAADAMRFLAAALPHREAIWWACLCARHGSGAASLPSDLSDAVDIAIRWINEPTETHREPARAKLDGTGDLGSPAGCLALAVAGTGGSLLAPSLPVVAPDATVTPQAVAGCLLMLSTEGDAAGIPDRERHFLDLGVEVATGKLPPPHGLDVAEEPAPS